LNFSTCRTSSDRTVTFPQLGYEFKCIPMQRSDILYYICGAHWPHLVNTIEPSICGGDVVLCQITLTTCWYAQQKWVKSDAMYYEISDLMFHVTTKSHKIIIY